MRLYKDTNTIEIITNSVIILQLILGSKLLSILRETALGNYHIIRYIEPESSMLNNHNQPHTFNRNKQFHQVRTKWE